MTGVRLLAWLLAALVPAAALAQPAPRIVIQAAGYFSGEVAAWTPDDRHIVTASGLSRRVTIWDAVSGIMVDHARLPAPSGGSSGEFLRVTGIEVSADGRTAIVRGIAVDVTKGDVAQARDYAVDLATRRVTLLPPRGLPASEGGLAAYVARADALSVIYEGGDAMTIAEAEAKLPSLPASHDGRTRLRRSDKGLVLSQAGSTPRTLATRDAVAFIDAALGPDGRRLVLVLDEQDREGSGRLTTLERFDAVSATYLPALRLSGDYRRVAWLDPGTLLVTNPGTSEDRASDDALDAALLPPALVVDAVSGTIRTRIPGRCYVQPAGDGFYIGAEPANCRKDARGGHGLALFDPARGAWQSIPISGDGKAFVNMIAVAPTGKAMAALLEEAGKQQLHVFDRDSGETINVLDAETVITGLRFAADGESLIIAGNGQLASWRFATSEPRVLEGATMVPQMIATDEAMLLVSGLMDDAIVRTDLAGGKALPRLELANAIAGGFLPGKPLFWAISALDGLRIWDTRDWSVLITTHLFPGQRFLAVTPEGRYDTNLGPDADQFRWIVPDAPFQSLAPQTFMRDYFEPRLTQRLVDCTTAGTCAAALKPLPPIAGLNRVLPQVRITNVRPGGTPATAIVTVEASEGVEPRAANGKTRSGLYNIRLFRNNRLVLQHPRQVVEARRQSVADFDRLAALAPDDRPPGWTPLEGLRSRPHEMQPEEVSAAMRRDLGEWRRLSRAEADATGTARLEFQVEMPTVAGTETSEFSAYAFNEDRVKSDTARLSYQRPPVTPRSPRAFVITIGVDAYVEPRLALQFAAGDARLIGDRLTAIPGYEVRRITLAGERGADGRTRRVTKEVIEILLSALSGADRKVSVDYLAELGFDASALEASTPDDIIIFSFSGHGWADKQGNFYLLPADAKWPGGSATPVVNSLISSENLTMYFGSVRAAEIAIIIDACHSAASVASVDFKPGPMGDPGLGQLAFDKGMRILAATQAADVALEDAALRQGRLTFALAREGLTAEGGQADLDGDGRILLDEWLRYAIRRVPLLGEDIRLGRVGGSAGSGGGSRARGFDFLDETPAAAAKIQEPSLFDFTGTPSPVILRRMR